MFKHAVAVLSILALSAVPSTAAQVGGASWYGPGFHGKKMANGKKFNENAISFAHKTLPLNSLVKVTNLENGRTICGPVFDRGPFIEGRIIDASKAAAIALRYKDQGVTKASVEPVKSC